MCFWNAVGLCSYQQPYSQLLLRIYVASASKFETISRGGASQEYGPRGLFIKVVRVSPLPICCLENSFSNISPLQERCTILMNNI